MDARAAGGAAGQGHAAFEKGAPERRLIKTEAREVTMKDSTSRPRADGLSRRTLVKAGLGAVAAPSVLRTIPANAQSRAIKIGHVSPRTGPLAGFGEADTFILEQVRGILAKGLAVGGKTYPVEIVSKDSQSSGSRASEVASELILGDKVDLILASATPDTTNPVADQAEVNEVPCITTNCPWQPYFFGRRGDPKKGFTWTYHFFWGLEDVIAAFLALWDGAPTNKVVGGLFPNDADGNAWGDPQRGLPPALAQAGYKLHDPGRYQVMNNDFTAQISAFKSAGADIVTGNMIPPDFATFWSQAAQQGFKPKIVTIGKALLFPSVIESLGARGNGLTSEIWWTPHHPFTSALTGQSAAQLTEAYTAATKRPWTQPIGFQHALFEVAIDVLKRAKNLESKSILDAIVATDYRSIVGQVKWTGQPVKNVTKTPLVAGQWQRKGDKFDLVITANKPAPEIPVGGKLQLLS
jgi:branched-chain amino acid transport system substrate-binding protein